MKKIIVVGGGAAGMIAAAESAKKGYSVTLLEKNNKLGKKLYITGKGRCNLTNACDVDTLLENTTSNPYFLYSSFYSFDSEALMKYFEDMSVPLKVERGNRVFPVSERSGDIVTALANNLHKHKVSVRLNTEVADILSEDDRVVGVEINGGKKLFADVCIIATGGLSYPSTGSTGDGYEFAKKFGHSISTLYPSLVPLKIKENWIAELAGLSLKNVAITLKEGKKAVYKDFGEMLFTHIGVSGPIILSSSRYLEAKKNCKLNIDLKPALDEKTLDARILRDFENHKNKDFGNTLDDLLPKKLIPVVVELSGIEPSKKVNNITKEERKNLVKTIKELSLTVGGTTGYNEAVITCGGVNCDEIDPSTMESKKMKGLFFAGEVIDVDGYTGGFNLQIAFSTGFLAGVSC